MEYKSTIRAFQGVLTGFSFEKAVSFPEDFAQKRYLSKMEDPNSDNAKLRLSACWETWIETDRNLPKKVILPSGEWYRARLILHSIMKHIPKEVSIDFPSGSEFFPTRGYNSLEARLCKSRWSVTRDCFDDFAKIVYGHKGLKRAFRKRYRHWFNRADFDINQVSSDMILWKHFRPYKDCSYRIFLWKLERICTFVEGSRFSTVPKNNEKDRPINVEPLGNLVVQRVWGNKIRTALRRSGLCDLNTLADRHRERIATQVATIDLANASDSVSIALCRFMLPEKIFGHLMRCRSPMIYGQDKAYHIPLKISSMGNGFTFELMTLILTSLCKSLDSSSSVFGDDIIIGQDYSSRLIPLLNEVGFEVNVGKSFTSGPFRESCGANYHDDFGYVESYDFKYPNDIHDCVLIYNKAALLAQRYRSFEKLRRVLHGFIPRALQGGPLCNDVYMSSKERSTDNSISVPDSRHMSGYFQTNGARQCPKLRKSRVLIAKNYQLPLSSVQTFIGFDWVPKLRTPTIRHLHKHWAKYEMYLDSGRVCKDVITGEGRWVTVAFVSIEGRVSRLSTTISVFPKDE